ncbi:ureidoglycolate lyase [Novosphingobium sp. YJ-S2-02]|uniref:Ureidoglycolate lyase n=1 Tax=Novosphingobium aureum TaxID=2792964 RepID=A0A931HDE1_9SPHN|nr:ureidoglycolate lyase [Novosphingobium aureum]MBH0113361.1 ureidoglycolate lyase [Novosphingobium aureum]
MTQTTVIKLEVEPASAEALAPFGDIVGRDAPVEPVSVDFYKGAVRMSYPTRFLSEHPVEMTLAQMVRREPEVRYMERHFQHTQAFLPLGGKPFIAVMAPPCDGDLPDLSQVRAFRFDGTAGFALKLGTWHEFPFAIEDDTDIVVVLSSQTGYDLKAKDAETEEAHGPDLDKKDIVARTGHVFRFELTE